MATHSSILAWKIQWSEEPGGLQSTGSQRVGHTEPLSRHTRVIYKDVVVPFGVFSVLSVCSVHSLQSHSHCHRLHSGIWVQVYE